MDHYDPDELNDIREELDGILKGHRDILNQEPRILKPLQEARDQAKFKYERVTEQQNREAA